MKNIYITGASGVVGSSLTQHFVNSTEFGVKAVSRRPCPLLPQDHPAQIQVKDLFGAEWLAKGDDDATILHCAGLANPRVEFKNFADLSRKHILPHIDMVERMLAKGWQGRLVFFSSGGAIYGDTLELPIREGHPTNPKGFYGLHKLCLERAFIQMARVHGIQLMILRVANPYGSLVHKPKQGVIPILLRAISEGLPFQMIGDGSAERDYIEIEDLCDAVERTVRLDMGARPTELLNIGSGVGTSLNTLIEVLESIIGEKLNRVHQPTLYDVQSNVLDCRRAETVLGWKAQIPLKTGLHRLTTRLKARNQLI